MATSIFALEIVPNFLLLSIKQHCGKRVCKRHLSIYVIYGGWIATRGEVEREDVKCLTSQVWSRSHVPEHSASVHATHEKPSSPKASSSVFFSSLL